MKCIQIYKEDKMKDIICKSCGAIYITNEIPTGMICLCNSKIFEFKELN